MNSRFKINFKSHKPYFWLVFFSAISWFVYGFLKRNSIENNGIPLYTKGVITKYKYGARVSPSFEFYFLYQGDTLEGRSYFKPNLRYNSKKDLNEKFVNHSFVVKYYEGNEWVNNILQECRLSDSITPPIGGWRDFPCNDVSGAGKKEFCK